MERFFKSLMSISSAEDGGVSLFGLIFRWALIAVLCVVIAIAVTLALDLYHERSLQPDLSKLGSIGDFIGGILNPILAFLVLLVLLATTRLQRQELADTREELERSASAAEKQAFENTFFNLLQLINENVQSSSIYVSTLEPEKTGTQCFAYIHSRMDARFRGGNNAPAIFPHYYRIYRHILGNYIRLIYWTLTFLRDNEDSSLGTGSIYGKILRAQLSDYELAILFYNCLSDYGENFVPLAKRFDLFNSLSDELVFEPSHFETLQSKYDSVV